MIKSHPHLSLAQDASVSRLTDSATVIDGAHSSSHQHPPPSRGRIKERGKENSYAFKSYFEKKHPAFTVYENSVQEVEGNYFFLAAEKKGEKKFLVTGKKEFMFYPVDQNAIELLCKTFPWLKPRACGLKNSFGFGDRLGIATPGHIRALKKYNFFPVFAQQSVRELERTGGRTFKEVLNSAIIGVFEEGYKNGFGADADHIKKISYLKEAVNAGFTFFTIDPSDKIGKKEIHSKEKSDAEWRKYENLYSGKKYRVGNSEFEFTEEILKNILLTYSEAVDFIESCHKFLKSKISSFDFEVSVDETSYSTTPIAHIFIVEELQRRKIEFQNLALRFPGKFEKGIDYKGDLKEFEENLTLHQKIREKFGPYKISLHSGSDKFKIYPIFKNILGNNFHVKTSGTSWIEAVKTIAEVNRPFFLEILNCGIKTFKENSASYEISANPETVDLENIRKENIEEIFVDENIRQIIHISYGSVLSEFREKFYSILRNTEEIYYKELETHLGKHLKMLN